MTISSKMPIVRSVDRDYLIFWFIVGRQSTGGGDCVEALDARGESIKVLSAKFLRGGAFCISRLDTSAYWSNDFVSASVDLLCRHCRAKCLWFSASAGFALSAVPC